MDFVLRIIQDFISKNFILLKHTHNLKLFDKITDSTNVKNTF